MESEEAVEEVIKLTPRAIFGINGKVKHGIRMGPNKTHMIFPLGSKLGIQNATTYKQEFLSGHTNEVSCLDVSRSGRYLASGQVNHMGFRAYVILWNFAERKEIARHDLHKVRVASVCFTAEEKYVISVGGRDDGTVIVFDIEARNPICRSVASLAINGNALLVCSLHKHDSFFLSAGDRHVRMWSILREKKKLMVHDVGLGKQQRYIISMRIDKNDEFAYLGTMTGDVLKIVLKCCDPTNVTQMGQYAAMIGAYGTHNPRKPFGKDCNRYVNGVRDIILVDTGLLLIGSGDGTLDLVEERKDVKEFMFKNYPSPTWPMFRILKHAKIQNSLISCITQISAIEYYVTTEQNEIYLLNVKTFAIKLIKTCHSNTIYRIIFPKRLSTVFATSGHESIRIWSIKRLQELLRIKVYNFDCCSLRFAHDGTSIVSVWNDGVIRAFTPITGRLIYAIPNAHNKGCSAVAISTTGRTLVTGGIEGQVRIWKIEPYRQSLIAVLKDHSGPVTSLDFNCFDTECVSSSSDGSCVIWDIKRLTRKQVITSNTQFMSVKFFPTGVQMLTCGSDGRISYWMTYNGSLIRELEGSKKTSLNSIAISETGDYFVSGGSDQMVKMWDYNRGIVLAQANEHASPITSVNYSPCGKFFVSGSKDGCLIIWDVPQKFWGKKPKMEEPPPAEPVKQAAVSSRVSTARSTTSLHKQENIDDLVTKSKGSLCCVECPPVTSNRKPELNENCGYVPDVRKC